MIKRLALIKGGFENAVILTFFFGIVLAMRPVGAYTVFALFVTALTVYLIKFRPWWFILVVLLTWPLRELFNVASDFTGIPFLSFNITGFFNILLIFAGVLYLLKAERDFFSFEPVLAYGLFILICSLSLLYTSNLTGGIRLLVRIVSPFSLYCILLGELRTRENAEKMLKIILFSAGIPSGMGLFQFLQGAGFHDPVGLMRLSSVFEHPNAFSYYLIIVFLAVLVFLFQAETKPKLAAFCAGGLVLVALIVLTYCRASLLAMALVILCFVLRHLAKWRRALFFITASCAIVFFFFPVGERLRPVVFFNEHHSSGNGANKNASSIRWRYEAWGYLLHSAVDAPFLGYGVGASLIRVKELFGEELFPHNEYIRILYENGITGLAVFLGFIAMMTLRGIRRIRNSGSGSYSYLMSAYFSAWVAFLFIMALDNVFVITSVSVYYWALLALGEV